MREEILFVENAFRATRHYRPGQPPTGERERWHGACLETPGAAGVTDHRFADGAELLDQLDLPPGSRAEATRVLRDPTPDPEPDDARLAAFADRYDVELRWATYRQDVVAGPVRRLSRDERRGCTVEVVATSPDGVSCADALPWGGASPGRLRAAAESVRAQVALPAAEYPSGGCAVVLGPGRAGAFFHELVGHPLEGDIVATSSSYLARRAGTRVAPDWLTVTDGWAESGTGVAAAIDDEGTAVTAVELLCAGTVAGALADAATGALLGTASSGHGRRLDYRHPVIPRMRHTAAIVRADRREPCTEPHVRPRGLGLRWMNLLTSDFELELAGGVLELGDGRTRRVGRGTVAGNALEVLAALRPGPAETRSYFRASRGCGKLGQFPLPVSFANGGVVIPAEVVRVRADA